MIIDWLIGIQLKFDFIWDLLSFVFSSNPFNRFLVRFDWLIHQLNPIKQPTKLKSNSMFKSIKFQSFEFDCLNFRLIFETKTTKCNLLSNKQTNKQSPNANSISLVFHINSFLNLQSIWLVSLRISSKFNWRLVKFNSFNRIKPQNKLTINQSIEWMFDLTVWNEFEWNVNKIQTHLHFNCFHLKSISFLSAKLTHNHSFVSCQSINQSISNEIFKSKSKVK